jgi:hypothetical protein
MDGLRKTAAGVAVAVTIASGGTIVIDATLPDLSLECVTNEQPVEQLDEKLRTYKIDEGLLQTRDMTAADRAKIKGCEIAKAVSGSTHAQGDLILEITDTLPIESGVEVFARAWNDKGQIGFGRDGSVDIERFVIINPPILVPDEKGEVVIEQPAIPEFDLPAQTFRYREDPAEAVAQVVASNIRGMVNKQNGSKIEPGKRGRTTTTVYAGANDGYAFDVETTWAAVRSAGGQGSSYTATILAIQSTRETATEWIIYRSPTPFDTSSIPDADTIDSAVFYFTPNTIGFSGVDESYAAIDKVTTITPATGDYAVSNWAGVDQATRRIFSDLVVNTESSMALNATGLGNINKTGTTNFGMRTNLDMDNTTPVSTSVERLFPYASEETGTTRDPRLVIEHTTGGGPPPSTRRIIQLD